MSEAQEKSVARLESIRRKQLLNRINALHYQGSPLLVCLRHNKYNQCLYLRAHPTPVSGDQAVAHWADDETLPATLAAYSLEKIILNSQQNSYEMCPKAFRFNSRGITFTIPESACEADYRKHVRFRCAEKTISATLSQNALVYSGNLIDYSAGGILIALQDETDNPLTWINESRTATLTVKEREVTVYSGIVKLVPRGSGQYLLLPDHEAAPRHQPREYRSRRQQLIPSPDLIFNHPVTGKKMTLKIHDLSSLGFSVTESESRASLIPGLLIRDARISLANNFFIPCVVQVVYLKKGEEADSVRVGLTILSMESQDHLRLISLVQQAQDSKAYISNVIDPSDLFDFFFESGFIYPKKYAELAEKKEQISHSYMELYQKNADINRHFVYQKEGRILGHFSALRVYAKTWFCQHHAALQTQRAGMKVVRAISEYVNDSYKLNPANIQYIIGYFQVSNRFPKRYFGDYADKIQDPQKTSLDCFAYIKEARRFADAPASPAEGWSILPTKDPDLVEFLGYYESTAGGLLPKALDLEQGRYNNQCLTEAYENNNLSRVRTLYTLHYHGQPKALIDVQSTDFGLNLSEITNAITVYMIDPDPGYFDMIRFAIRSFALREKKMSDPVMIYPNNYLSLCGVDADKEYTMWTLNVPDGMETYMAWMNRFCR